MQLYSTNRPPSNVFRLTALFSVLMVLLLSVFSASPQLHAWLHAHDGTSQQATFGGNEQKAPGQDDDDGCAVTMFINGVIAATVGLLAIVAVWRLLNLAVIGGAEVFRQVPRYWLPPLCGPPLS